VIHLKNETVATTPFLLVLPIFWVFTTAVDAIIKISASNSQYHTTNNNAPIPTRYLNSRAQKIMFLTKTTDLFLKAHFFCKITSHDVLFTALFNAAQIAKINEIVSRNNSPK